MAQVVSKERALPAVSWPGLQLGRKERRLLLFVGDVLALSAAGTLAYALWRGLAPHSAESSRALAAGVPWAWWLGVAWLLLWALSGGYDLRLAARSRSVLRRLLTTTAVFAVVYLGLYFLVSLPPYALPLKWGGFASVRPLRLLPTLFTLFALLAELGWRTLYARVLTGERFRRRLLIVGAGLSGRTLLEALRGRGEGAYEVLGFVDDDPSLQGAAVPSFMPDEGGQTRRVLGDRHALKDLIVEHGVSTVVLAVRQEVNGELLPLLLDCLELGVEIVPMPVFYEQLTGRVPVEHVGNSWYVAMPIQHPSTGSLYALARRIVDLALGCLGLVLTALATPFIALAIRLDSPGPVFFVQERVGQGGRVFRVLKFRSMVEGAEKGKAVWAQEDDPRITRVGRFLRRSHLDELPQFLNVVRGEMSIVGPRPERPEFAEVLAKQIPFYRVRHAVKPGLAGWAMLQQGYASSTEDALLKLQYDLYYIKHQSLWLDLVILVRTVVHMLGLRGR
ncbi:MAG: sugar transferase [Anaerolineae bacterium]